MTGARERPGFLRRVWRSRRVRLALILYGVALLLSHVWTRVLDAPRAPDPDVALVTVPEMNDDGPVGDATIDVGVRGWTPVRAPAPSGVVTGGMTVRDVRPWTRADPTGGPAPILLLHGSPSRGGADFDVMGPELARAAGRTVLAIDRPGYGVSSKWVERYSLRANARVANAVLDELGYERAHALGWSQGGGAAIWMARFDPARIASVTLLASIGVQEGEGSGDYHFEHAKYALGFPFVVALPELVPHFGLLGPTWLRHAFIRDFWDTDQRPIREVLASFETPTLVVHGRDDPLVPAWTAREHQHITRGARLLMLDASHFFVFMGTDHARETRRVMHGAIAWFVDRHDDPDAAPVPGVVDRAPSRGASERTIAGIDFTRSTHWTLVVLIIALGTLISEDLTVIAAGLLVSTQQVDIGVAILGCYIGILGGDWALVLIGRFAGRRVLRWRFFRKAIPERSLTRWEKMFDRHLAKTVFLSRMLPGTRLPMYVSAGILSRRLPEFMFWMSLAIAIWVPVLLVLAVLIGRPVYAFFADVFHGPWAIVAAFAVLFILIRIATYEATYSGRHKLSADLRRFVAHEFWPPVIFYLPLVPKLLQLGLTHKGPMTFTCADPGIQPAGGVVHEPKTDIVHALEATAARMERPDLVLAARRAPMHDDPVERTSRTLDLIERDAALGGLPVVLKPEAGERGFGVRIARTREDVHAYLESMPVPVQVQRYHPGPVEAGLLWSRVPTPGTPVDEWPGEIFAITRKTFPVLVGDGEHTIEHLIWEHERYRMQAEVFLARFEERLDDVLAAGEELPLARVGNHAQGARFSDGSDMRTDELVRTVEALAQGYRHAETGARVDFGRFDVRAASEEELKAGRFAVVELNGVLSEATNMYDPGRSAWWAYALLFRQWTRVYDIGVARRGEGVRPLSVPGLVRLMRRHAKERPMHIRSD